MRPTQGPPDTADVSQLGEVQSWKRIAALRIEAVDIVRAEPEGRNPGWKRRFGGLVQPRHIAVAERQDRRVVEDFRVVEHQYLGRVLPGPVGRVEIAMVRRHRGEPGLVGLVVDVEPAQRPVVGQLVLDFDGPHFGRVCNRRRREGVGVVVFVRPERIARDGLCRPRLRQVEANRARCRMVARDDRVREQTAGGQRPGSSRWTPGGHHSAAAPRVEDLDGSPADRRRGEIAFALVQARPEVLNVVPRRRVIVFGGGPKERAVSQNWAAKPAPIELEVILGQSRLFLGPACNVVEVIQRLTPDRTGLVEAAAMECVGPGLGCCIKDASARPAYLGVIGVHLDLDLIDRLDRRRDCWQPRQVPDSHAVDQIVVGADAAAAQRDARQVGPVLLPLELRVADRIDGRNRDRHREGRAARRRQILQCLLTDRGPQ